MIDARSRLIVALDVPGRVEALALVDRLAGQAGLFKVGLELFVREGPRIVRELRERDKQVFLDLKLHDIPNTVARAVRSAGVLSVQMLTVHAAGGRPMLEAALEAAAAFSQPPLVLAVTALTSLSSADTAALGVSMPVGEWAGRLARLAVDSGIRGLVASPLEVAALRQACGSETTLVVPGIRPPGAGKQDQARTADPAGAFRAGADYIVVGRPITQAPDPALAAKAIVADIAAAQ